MPLSVLVHPKRAGRYTVAWCYVVGFTAADIAVWTMSPAQRLMLVQSASTNVYNLRHDPLGSMIVSAFVPTGFFAAWPLLVAVAMFGAGRVLGNWRTAVVCGIGHVVGTLVSEGIVAYRIAHGSLPRADAHISDVGPSYIVVAALAVAVLYGPWTARIAAAVDLALLIVIGGIFSGLSTLDVAAVGHTTAIVLGAASGSVLVWRSQRLQRADERRDALPAG